MKRIAFALCVAASLPVGCMKQGAALSDFKPFTSGSGQFTVEFPGDPVATTHTEQTPFGPVVIYNFQVLLDGAEYVVSFDDFPLPAWAPFSVEGGLDGTGKGVAQSMGAKMASEKKIALGQWPGREWSFTGAGNGKEDFLWRCYYVARRQYQIAVGWPPGHQPPTEVIDEFFASLKITYK